MPAKDTITGKQALALTALIECDTLEEAAKRVGVNPRTLHRWLNENEPFQKAFRDAKRAIVAQVARRLTSAMEDAVTTLEQIIGDMGAPHGARVHAARQVLEFGHKAFEVENLQVQIEELRKDLEEMREAEEDDDREDFGMEDACLPS